MLNHLEVYSAFHFLARYRYHELLLEILVDWTLVCKQKKG